MPTKTTPKTAARKTTTARKPVKADVSSPAAEARRKETKSTKVEAPAKPKAPPPAPAKPSEPARKPSAAAAKSTAEPATPETPKAPKQVMETVSLIDEKKPRPKRAEGDAKTKSFLPPISRIREPVPPPAPAAPPPPPPAPEPTAAPADIATAEPEVEQKIIHIKPPIIVKELALQLGLKPHQLIAELMALNIFANINQTIEPDIATQICEKHGFVFEMERREKGAASTR